MNKPQMCAVIAAFLVDPAEVAKCRNWASYPKTDLQERKDVAQDLAKDMIAGVEEAIVKRILELL